MWEESLRKYLCKRNQLKQGNQWELQRFHGASKYHLSWRSWSSPQGLLHPFKYCSDELTKPAFIWSIPMTLGYNSFSISPREELHSGSGVGGYFFWGASSVILKVHDDYLQYNRKGTEYHKPNLKKVTWTTWVHAHYTCSCKWLV